MKYKTLDEIFEEFGLLLTDEERKELKRKLILNHKEYSKALADDIIFGTSILEIDSEGCATRIDPLSEKGQEVIIKLARNETIHNI